MWPSPTSPWRPPPGVFDKASGEGRGALFLRCTLWRQPAENVAESLVKGSRVIVTGRLRQRSFETRDGEKRTVIELEVDEIGPSLRHVTSRITRTGKSTSDTTTIEHTTRDPSGEAPATTLSPHRAPRGGTGPPSASSGVPELRSWPAAWRGGFPPRHSLIPYRTP